MKKVLATLLILCTITFAFAQNVPNGGFENWDNDTVATDWTSTFNVSTTIEYMGFPIPVNINYSSASKVSEAHNGSFAMRIQGKVLLNGMMTVPGICHLGDFDTDAILNTDFDNLDLSSFNLTDYIHGGIPFTQIPSQLSAWVKYFPTADTMQITLLATRWNNNACEIVARGDFMTGETMVDFTEINFSIDTLIPNATPDTLNVIFTTANSSDCSAESDLIVDDVVLTLESGIVELNTDKFTVSPNPATDYFYISPAQKNTTYEAQLFDVTGKSVWNKMNLLNDYQVDVSNLTHGTYFLQINQNGKISSQKIIVK
ncbi:MAG: T9SS type A sorting domain-containing protein [Bacteroidales bacterium]|nr:T9SS type A sorting domain-containing protein [Bacteroidales bacterium]